MLKLYRNRAAKCYIQNVIYNSVKKVVFSEILLGEYQCGLCSNRSTTDQISEVKHSLQDVLNLILTYTFFYRV